MHFQRQIQTLVVAAFAVSGTALAADEPKLPPAPACTTPEHRQFDFWLGDWEVRDPAGKIVGRNRLASLHKGCVMAESWTGNGGFSGSSLNAYDAEKKRWHQTWADSGGGLLLLDGTWSGGRMVLAGDAPTEGKPGETASNRITWQPLPDGRVRQLWETSTDKGKTWTVAFDGYYTKVSSP
jgi:hypothetical protein